MPQESAAPAAKREPSDLQLLRLRINGELLVRHMFYQQFESLMLVSTCAVANFFFVEIWVSYFASFSSRTLLI
jgi:hypothetical protein